MKKKLLIMLLVGIVALTGCGNSAGTEDTSKSESSEKSDVKFVEIQGEKVNVSKAEEIKLGETYETDSNLEFSLFKVSAKNKMECVSGNGMFYEADSGEKYFDVVLNVENKGQDVFDTDSIKCVFIDENENSTEQILVAAEDSQDYLDQYAQISALDKTKLHIGALVQESVNKGTLYFKTGNSAYFIKCDASQEISNKTSIDFEEEILVYSYASFKLIKTEYTQDVLPSDTSGYYSHYPVNDPASDVYYVVYVDVTNLSNANIVSDKILSIRAKYDGKYEYTANMVLEKKDGTGFDYGNITNIAPLETRRCLFMFEVPQKVQEMPVELNIYFNGNEYGYSN